MHQQNQLYHAVMLGLEVMAYQFLAEQEELARIEASYWGSDLTVPQLQKRLDKANQQAADTYLLARSGAFDMVAGQTNPWEVVP